MSRQHLGSHPRLDLAGRSRPWCPPDRSCGRAGTEPKTDEDTVGVGQVTDDLAQRAREPAHEGGDGEHIVIAGERGVLEQVDRLDLVVPAEVSLTQVGQIADRLQGLRRLTGHIETEMPDLEALV